MTYPLTNELGVGWLGHSRVSLRLIKPAYHGDELLVSLDQADDQTYRVECRNAADVLLADIRSYCRSRCRRWILTRRFQVQRSRPT